MPSFAPASRDKAPPLEATPLVAVSRELGGFYVPQFEVRIAGAGLPQDVLRDVTEVTYTDKLEEIDTCELSVNNWDSTLNAFKYVGAEQFDDKGNPQDPDGTRSQYWKLFDPCKQRVEVKLGYVGQLETVMFGQFTTVEPSYSSGPPSLKVRLLNELHQLRGKRYSGNWGGKKDSEIAELISKEPDKDRGGKKRFPVELRTDPTAKRDEKAITYVGQKNEFDIDFLWKRARLNGYVVRLNIDDTTGDHFVYFGPSKEPSVPVCYRLDWGKSLLDFKPTLTTGNQFKSVTVHGWDRATQKPIEEKIDFDDKRIKLPNADIGYLVRNCDAREEHVVDKPVYSKAEAAKLAKDLLFDQNKQMVKATGTTVGLPRLRAGSKVQIGGLGSRISGVYFVTSTTHTLGSNGYTTRFEARREGALPPGSKP